MKKRELQWATNERFRIEGGRDRSIFLILYLQQLKRRDFIIQYRTSY